MNKTKTVINKLKEILNKVYCWDILVSDVKKELINRNLGNPIKVLDRKVKTYYHCPKDYPVEYYTKTFLHENTLYLTDLGKIVRVIEKHEYEYSFEIKIRYLHF